MSIWITSLISLNKTRLDLQKKTYTLWCLLTNFPFHSTTLLQWSNTNLNEQQTVFMVHLWGVHSFLEGSMSSVNHLFWSCYYPVSLCTPWRLDLWKGPSRGLLPYLKRVLPLPTPIEHHSKTSTHYWVCCWAKIPEPTTDDNRLKDFYHNCKNSTSKQIHIFFFCYTDALFRISSMSNSFEYDTRWVVMSIHFSTGPSKLFNFFFKITDALFRISSMSNSFEYDTRWVVLSLHFSTGPSKLFKFPEIVSHK